MTPTINDALLPGFADPVLESQAMFRLIMQAMANPGSVQRSSLPLIAPAPLQSAAAGLALALIDADTPLWLQPGALRDRLGGYFRFHCGCPLVEQPEQAVFALISDAMAMPPLAAFAQGSDEFPDRSATLIIELAGLTGGAEWRLCGPGIETIRNFAPLGLLPDFVQWVSANHRQFPRGVDLVFTSGQELAALPRSTDPGV